MTGYMAIQAATSVLDRVDRGLLALMEMVIERLSVRLQEPSLKIGVKFCLGSIVWSANPPTRTLSDASNNAPKDSSQSPMQGTQSAQMRLKCGRWSCKVMRCVARQ